MAAEKTKVEGRARLDASLLSPVLSERSNLLQLVRDQLERSPLLTKQLHASRSENLDRAAEKRAAEVWDFLEALRSTRQELIDETDDAITSWKIKQETDTMRVMYRPGPEGTPFHTYCVEGIIAGSMLNAACVAWEVPSHRTWWPQFNVPTFKIIESRWVKRIRVGEDLALVKVKVPWPLAPREALMTQFELEYFKDDLLVILIGTAPSDPDEIDVEVHGFSGDELPPATQDLVRIDVGGGFVIQRLSSDLNFFRVIVNMDIKLDFVPPTIINFITRQLAGNGYKLYQKAVLASSKSTGAGKLYDELISREPLYSRIQTRMQEELESRKRRALVAEMKQQDQQITLVEKPAGKICEVNQKNLRNDVIDPEVEWALDVLDKMIGMVGEWKSQQSVIIHSSPLESEEEEANGNLEVSECLEGTAEVNGGERESFSASSSKKKQQRQLKRRNQQHWRSLALNSLRFWHKRSISN